MIQQSQQFDKNLFKNLYDDLFSMKIEMENAPENQEGHDWIDIDDVIWMNKQFKKLDKK